MHKTSLAVLAVLMAVANVTVADVRVRIINGTSLEVPVRTVTYDNGKYNVVITTSPSPSSGSVTLAVESYPAVGGDPQALDVIRYVRVESNGAGKVAIVSVTTATGSSTKLVGVEEFSVTTTDAVPDGDVYAAVSVVKRPNGTGGVVGFESQVGGSVTAHSISSVFAEGNINASVVALQASVGDSSISTVQSNSGIFGDVLAPYGSIINQVYANNDIGSAGRPVTIYGKNGVKIVQGNNLYADIGVDLTAGTPSMQRMRAIGNFTGTLVAGHVDQVGTGTANTALNIGGDLSGNVLVQSYFAGSINVTGDVAVGSLLRIGGSLNSSGHTFTSGPVKGQVIINGLNQGSTWTVPATVDGTSLTGIPTYAQTSSQLGGGAIGRTPFQLHTNDCDPPNGGAYPSLNRIKLRFYGPITVSGSAFPVIVSYCPNLGGCAPQNWLDLSDHFTAAVSTSARQLTLTWSPPPGSQWGGTMPDGIWFVEPLQSNVINCANLVTTSTVPVATFEYTCYVDSSM